MTHWRDLTDNELILALARAYRWDYWARVCDGTVARMLRDRRKDLAVYDEIDALLGGAQLKAAA